MRLKKKLRRPPFDPLSAALGLVAGVLVTAAARAVSAMPPEQQVELLKSLAAALRVPPPAKPATSVVVKALPTTRWMCPDCGTNLYPTPGVTEYEPCGNQYWTTKHLPRRSPGGEG